MQNHSINPWAVSQEEKTGTTIQTLDFRRYLPAAGRDTRPLAYKKSAYLHSLGILFDIPSVSVTLLTTSPFG